MTTPKLSIFWARGIIRSMRASMGAKVCELSPDHLLFAVGEARIYFANPRALYAKWAAEHTERLVLAPKAPWLQCSTPQN